MGIFQNHLMGAAAAAAANGGANTGRAINFGGYDDVNVIDYFDTASAGNATDFGDLTDGGSSGEANANDTVSLFYFGRRNSVANNFLSILLDALAPYPPELKAIVELLQLPVLFSAPSVESP